MGRGACLLPRPKRTHALSAGPLDQSGCSRSVCRYGCRQSLVSRGGSDPRSGSPEGVEGMNLLDRIACKANYAAYVKKNNAAKTEPEGRIDNAVFQYC